MVLMTKSIEKKADNIRKAKDQKYVFDRFFKSDMTRNEDKVGSGIGLAIAKEFMLAHGENITVKSEEGKGATFAFSLKLAEKE